MKALSRMRKKQFIKYLFTTFLALANIFSFSPSPTLANGNDTLATSNTFTLQGDFTAAGVGLRSFGQGDIQITEIPEGASVYRAFLYWATLGNVSTFTSPTLNGQPVSGEVIGTTGDTCWEASQNFVYRADVTSLVDGNGTYAVAGLPDSIFDGNDSQGASLVVVYQSTSLPLRTVILRDGAVALNFSRNAYTDTITGFSYDEPVTNARVTYLIGDGQATWDTGNISFNGVPVASNVFSGVDGNYWGTHTFDVTSLVTSGSATTTINNNDPGNPSSPDCLLWAATLFSVTAETLPAAQNRFSDFDRYQLYGDVTAAGVGLRGVGSGNITLDGVPEDGIIHKAFLYWATLGNSSRFTSPTLNGTVVDGVVIGVSKDTCWGAARNFVYRADVTSLVSGNGSYAIAGLPASLPEGNDSQGASLVMVYSQPGVYRSIILRDGAVTLDLDVNSYTDVFTNFTADQPLADAHMIYLVGDGEARWNDGNVNFEGVEIGNNVFTGVDGPQWGTLNFDVTGLVTEPEATTTINNQYPADPQSPDCLLWAASIFAVQSEEPVSQYSYRAFIPFIPR